jgi:DnaJ homolog subfamily C member 2
MASATVIPRALPTLPEGWTAEKDFKPLGVVSPGTQRTIEPVGPHYLAHARRARNKRTFSEDDRIQAQEKAKKIEKDEESEESEPEDLMMLQREAKDWKVS